MALTKNDLQQIGQIIDERLDSKLKPLKKGISYIRETLDLVVKNYGEADVKLGRRVQKIEKHLGLPSN